MLNLSTGAFRDVTVEDLDGAAFYVSDSEAVVTALKAHDVAVGLAASLGGHLDATNVRLSAPTQVGVVAWGRSRVSARRTCSPRRRSCCSTAGAARPALPPPAAGFTIRQTGAGTRQA